MSIFVDKHTKLLVQGITGRDGSFHAASMLEYGTKVVGGTPDVPAAAVGSGAVGNFEGHLYVGTSSWLTCHVPFKKTDILHNMASLPSALPGRYFVGNEQETAGACMTWLRDSLFFRDDVLDPGEWVQFHGQALAQQRQEFFVPVIEPERGERALQSGKIEHVERPVSGSR